MAVISDKQAREYASNAGFGGDAQDIIIAIAYAESSLDTHPPDNINVGGEYPGSHDRGILQINNQAHSEVSDGCAYDPQCAFFAGFTISSHGTNFTPWSTYTGGQYLAYYKKGTSGSGGGTFSVEQVRQSMVPRYQWFSGYGEPRNGGTSHEGEDLGANKGSKAYFPESGSIYFPSDDVSLGHSDGKGGNVCYLAGDSGLYWYGAHFLNQHTFAEHQRVKKGDVWGLIGQSGDAATAKPHLHYQVTDDPHTWTGKNPAVVLANGIPGTNPGGGGGTARPDSITLYDAPNYTGNSYTLKKDEPKVTVGLYFHHAGHIESIRFNGSGAVTVFENINYAGESIVFTGDVPDVLDALPWFKRDNEIKAISSIKFGGGSSSGGGGIGGVGTKVLDYLSHYIFVNSLGEDVHRTISTVPGFSGIVLAVDEAMELPGWIDHGSTNAGDIIRSVSDSFFSNVMGITVRFLVAIIGLILIVGLLLSLVRSVTGVEPKDAVALAAL